MAKLFLESTDTTYKVSSANTKVYGATGDQVVTVDAAATGVTFDANVEGVSFSGATSDFTYKQLGLTDLGVYKAGALFATVAIQDDATGSLLTFSNGTVATKFATTGGVTGLTFGGTAVSATTAATVTPATIDATTGNGSTSTPVTGSTFTLTTGVDTFTGTSGNDSFSGPLDSLTVLDSIDGGAGNDTLTVSTTGTSLPTGVSVTNVETVNVSTTGTGYTLNASGFTGLKSLTTTVAGNGAATNVTAPATATSLVISGATDTAAAGLADVTVIGGGGNLSVTASTAAAANGINVGQTAVANAYSSISTTGGEIVLIRDRSGTAAATGSTLKTVTITNAGGDQTITANGLTTLNLSGLVGATTVGDTTITAAAGTRALTLNLNGIDVGGDGAVTVGTLTTTDATATSVAITNSGSATYDAAGAFAAATAVTVDASAALTLDDLTAGVATTVGISGTAPITITTDTFDAAVVITSTNSAGVTLSQALTTGQQFVGTSSSGNDVIEIGATTKAITTGAGNDSIISTGTVGTGGSVDAGDGIDNITLTSAQAEAADNSSTFNAKFKNFETLTISNALSATADIDLAGINAVSKVVLAFGGGHATTAILRSFVDNGTLELDANATGVTALVNGALFSASNIINVQLSKTGGALTAGTITTTGVETVNIAAADVLSAGSDTAAVVHTITLVDPQATTLKVTGNNGLTLTNTGNTAVTSFDASGVVANGALDTAANLAVTFTSANTTSTATVKIIGGAGNDVLTGVGALDSISGGAGADTITGGAGADTLTGGAGADVFRYDTIATTTGAAGVNVDRITDFVAGTDKINFARGANALTGVTTDGTGDAVATMAAVVADATTVASISDVYSALAAYNTLTASAADGTATVAQVYTFANGAAAGTYLVVNDTSAGFQAATDVVINITGLSGTLSAADFTFAV